MRRTANHAVGRARGPWRIGAAALAFALLLVGGCARHTVTRGWVRVDALSGLHPAAPMLADLDRRMAGLEDQRRRILARTALEAPPAQVRHETPALDAMPTSDAWPAPDEAWPHITADALDRLAAQGLADRDQQYPRRARELHAMLLEGLHQRLEDLRREAAARRAAINADYARIIRRLELGVDAGEAMVDRPPYFPEGAQRLTDRRARLARTQADRAAALRAVDVRLADDIAAAQREFAEALAGHRRQLWYNMTGAVNDRLAIEHARRTAAAPPPWPAPPPLVLPAVSPGAMTLDAPDLARRFAGADAEARQDTARALAAIDTERAALRRRRVDLALTINADTRRAAEALAHQHDATLAFTDDGSADMTAAALGWLKGFWHPGAE